MIAPEQIAQRLGIGLRDGAEEASEDSLTIRCLRQHLGHQLGHVILTGRDRHIAVRSDAAIASDEALLLESRQDGMDRCQRELAIREDFADRSLRYRLRYSVSLKYKQISSAAPHYIWDAAFLMCPPSCVYKIKTIIPL